MISGTERIDKENLTLELDSIYELRSLLEKSTDFQKEVDIITIGYDTLNVSFDDTIIGNAIYNETDSRLYMSTVRGLANGVYKTSRFFA